MESLEKLYQVLAKYKNFDEGDNIEKFLETTDKIILKKNHNSIKILLEYFDDNTEYLWVFDSISSSIEYYSVNIYVSELLKNLNILLLKAPIFADNFFNRIFNAPAYLKVFRENLHLASKGSLLKLFDVMEKESPHHHELLVELRKEVESRKD